MFCPKCGGGAYLADEDLLKVVDNTQPMKVVIKQTFVCRACTDKFSRVASDDMDSRRKASDGTIVTTSAMDMFSVTEKEKKAEPEEDTGAGIKFLDSV